MGHKVAPVSQEWYTPPDYIRIVKSVLGEIWLDPASSPAANEIVQARQFYQVGDNALGRDWWSTTLFLNPPFGRDPESGKHNMPLWTTKLDRQYRAGIVQEAILLCNANTGTAWFKRLFDYPICFVDHRIHFIEGRTGKPQSSPMYDQCFVYFGISKERFAREFSVLGSVVQRIA